MKRIIYLNRYRVVADESGSPAELRRAGAGVTYKAQDVQSGAEAAVEVIPAVGLRSGVREELEREALAAKELTHINLPAVLAFGAEADHLVYASEYFDGTSAEAWVTTHGPMPVGPVLRIALQIVSALGAAVFHGIMHRAINPRNVILVPGQTPQGDWPLVKILSLVGVPPTFAGPRDADVAADFAAQFTSREQLERGTVDFEAEMYSLGATLWFLLTGAAPVPGVALPRAAGIPKPVLHLLTQMLSSDPEKRPHDPLAFQEEIRACLGQVERREAIGRKFGVPVPAAVPVIKREPRFSFSWRPLAFAAVVLAAAFVTALVIHAGWRPDRFFAGFGRAKPIGVPIGVPEKSAPVATVESVDERALSVSETTPLAPAMAVAPDEVSGPLSGPPVLTSNATADEPPPPSEAIAISDETVLPEGQTPALVAQSVPPPATEETRSNESDGSFPEPATPRTAVPEGSAQSSQTVAKNENATEPAPPSEGPTESVDPPTYAVRGSEEGKRSREKENSETVTEEIPAARILPGVERPIAAEPVAPATRATKTKKRPKRIDGMEVRAAEPVDEADLMPPPKRPPRSDGADFVGIAPDGSLIFETPSPERSPVKPRR